MLSKVSYVVGVEQHCSVVLWLCMVQLSRRVHRVSHLKLVLGGIKFGYRLAALHSGYCRM